MKIEEVSEGALGRTHYVLEYGLMLSIFFPTSFSPMSFFPTSFFPTSILDGFFLTSFFQRVFPDEFFLTSFSKPVFANELFPTNFSWQVLMSIFQHAFAKSFVSDKYLEPTPCMKYLSTKFLFSWRGVGSSRSIFWQVFFQGTSYEDFAQILSLFLELQLLGDNT